MSILYHLFLLCFYFLTCLTFPILFFRYSGHCTGDFRVESGVDSSDAFILSGATDGHVWCWDLVKGEVVSKLEHSPGLVVNSLHTHPSKSALVTAAGTTVKLWGKPEFLDSD